MACYRRKSTVWPGKLISSKKHLKTAISRRQIWASPHFGKIWRPNCWHQGYPWKVWGITVQTSYWEGRWHQNWVRNRPTKNNRMRTRKLVKNLNFFTLRPPAPKRREISGWVQRVKWCLHKGQQMPCSQKVSRKMTWWQGGGGLDIP